MEIGALLVTRAAPSIPVWLEGTGCVSGQKRSFVFLFSCLREGALGCYLHVKELDGH